MSNRLERAPRRVWPCREPRPRAASDAQTACSGGCLRRRGSRRGRVACARRHPRGYELRRHRPPAARRRRRGRRASRAALRVERIPRRRTPASRSARKRFAPTKPPAPVTRTRLLPSSNTYRGRRHLRSPRPRAHAPPARAPHGALPTSRSDRDAASLTAARMRGSSTSSCRPTMSRRNERRRMLNSQRRRASSPIRSRQRSGSPPSGTVSAATPNGTSKAARTSSTVPSTSAVKIDGLPRSIARSLRPRNTRETGCRGEFACA